MKGELNEKQKHPLRAKLKKQKKPPTPGDMKLSNRHLKERIAFNTDHAQDHQEEVDKARSILKSRGIRL